MSFCALIRPYRFTKRTALTALPRLCVIALACWTTHAWADTPPTGADAGGLHTSVVAVHERIDALATWLRIESAPGALALITALENEDPETHAQDDTWPADTCNAIVEAIERYTQDLPEDRNRWEGAQTEASALITIAMRCDTPRLYEMAMRSISHALVHMRQSLATHAFSNALAMLSTANNAHTFYQTDPRLLIPYFESLMSLKDFASLERITDAILQQKPDVAVDRIEHYQHIATLAPSVTLDVNAPAACTPLLNDQEIQGETITLKTGRYRLGCKGQAAFILRYTTNDHALFPTNQ